jgi:hypothetical protein
MTEAAEKPVKKGNASWRPAKTLEVKHQRPGFRQRWVNTDPANVQKKQAEGWVYSKEEHDRPKGVDHGKNLGTVSQYRDLVLMEIPEETAQARAEYYRQETQAMVGGITKRLKNKIAEGNAATYGEIQINDKPI